MQKRVCIWIDSKFWKQLKVEAAQGDTSVSALIRAAVYEAYPNHGTPMPIAKLLDSGLLTRGIPDDKEIVERRKKDEPKSKPVLERSEGYATASKLLPREP